MNDEKAKPGRPVRVNLELPGDLEATYANFTLITHSSSEVIMDFARLLPNTPKTRIYARVIMTPVNAKLLHDALGENLRKFEDKYGEIKAAPQDFETTRQLGFRK